MYNIKIYERDWTTLKDTIEIEKLESISNFSSQVNWWFSNISVWIAYKITDTSIEISDIIKIQFLKNIIYTGSILDVKKIYWKDTEWIEINAIWYSSLLTLFQTNAIYSDTASNIVKDLINDFNIEYWNSILSYDVSSIPDSVWTLDLDFSSYKTYFEAMTSVANASGLFFFIDLDWKVYFREKSSYNSHTLSIWSDVDELTIEEDWKELVNYLILKYNWWLAIYQDAWSIALYWKREKYLDKSSELSNLSTANEFWNNYILQYKDKIKKVSVLANRSDELLEINWEDFFSIKWWDLIKVRNIWYIINNLQVAKITYWVEKATIELERSYSFAKEIFIS